MADSPATRRTIPWMVGLGLVLLAMAAAVGAVFYAWIDVAAPGRSRLNHAIGIMCMWAVPTFIVGAVAAPRLIHRRGPHKPLT